jgi:hypothetical protein
VNGEKQGGSARYGEVGGEFAAAVKSGRLELPLPGAGRTMQRWEAFASLAQRDLSLARLCEGHLRGSTAPSVAETEGLV